jgi:hypothetical protein
MKIYICIVLILFNKLPAAGPPGSRPAQFSNGTFGPGPALDSRSLRTLAAVHEAGMHACSVSCIRQSAKPCCINVCHAVIRSKQTKVMNARETTLCIHGAAKHSVPGGGRGSSNKSIAATAGKAPHLYHNHWRPVSHTTYPNQVYESA